MTEIKGDFFDSDIVEVQPDKFIAYFERLIVTGSRRYILELKDLTVYGKADDLNHPDVLSRLLKHGTPFMDAIAFLSYQNKPVNILQDPASVSGAILAKSRFINVAKALYFFYFMYLVRGNTGNDDDKVASPLVPAFLINIMKFSGTIGEIRTTISSFDLNKIPADWIKLIKIKNLGTETKQRFGLQVAGHRMLKPFIFFNPDGPKAKELSDVVKAVKDFTMKGPTWDIHSITRTADVAAALGPLNANLGNLMLDVFSDAQLEDMVRHKLIFSKPKRAYGFNNYLQYNDRTFNRFTDFIFPA